MYGRRLIFIILALIAAFLLFLVISFYVYPLINPDAADMSQNISAPKPSVGDYPYDYVKYGPDRVQQLQKKIESLEQQIEDKEDREEQMLATIDSLYEVTEQQKQKLARQGEGEEGGERRQQGARSQFASAGGGSSFSPFGGDGQESDDPIGELAKSLATLDEEELGPILNRLSDAQLVQLYESTSNIRREKLLRSLDPGKAATLIRRVM